MSSFSFGGFSFDEAGFDRVFQSPEGPVGQHLEQIGKTVAVKADESIIEASPIYPHDGFPYSISGDLKRSIGTALGRDEQGVFAGVGASAEHRGFDYPRALETGDASVHGTRFPWISAACIDMGLDYRPLV